MISFHDCALNLGYGIFCQLPAKAPSVAFAAFIFVSVPQNTLRKAAAPVPYVNYNIICQRIYVQTDMVQCGVYHYFYAVAGWIGAFLYLLSDIVKMIIYSTIESAMISDYFCAALRKSPNFHVLS